eukprot:COSAG01_NODE_7721_length_3084_cov_53.575544_6_plen_194_part_00
MASIYTVIRIAIRIAIITRCQTVSRARLCLVSLHAAALLLAAGRWPLAAGCWLLAAGRWPLAAGRWPMSSSDDEGEPSAFLLTRRIWEAEARTEELQAARARARARAAWRYRGPQKSIARNRAPRKTITLPAANYLVGAAGGAAGGAEGGAEGPKPLVARTRGNVSHVLCGVIMYVIVQLWLSSTLPSALPSI